MVESQKQDIIDLIEEEGMEVALAEYDEYEDFEDAQFTKLVKIYFRSINNIKEYLGME